MQLNPIEKNQILRSLERAIEVTDPPHVDSLRHAHAIIHGIETASPCRQCLDYSPGDHCARWKQTIPTEWLEVGCDQWINDVPF